MCRHVEYWSLILAVISVVTFGIQARYHRGFLTSLERSEPTLWGRFEAKKNWMDGADKSGVAGAQWYLLKGDFSELMDAELIARARRARAAAIACLVAFGAWGVFLWTTQAFPRLSCIPGLAG